MVTKRRLKKEVKIIGSIIIIAVMLLIILINYLNRINSLSYKLGKVGYTKEEITVINEKLDKNQIKELLNKKYSSDLDDLLKEKYFIYNKLDRYIAYKENNPDKLIRDVIEEVNTNRDKEYYTDVISADLNQGDLVLVNRYYYLEEDYEPQNLISVPLTYAYDGVKIIDYVFEAFKDLYNDAKSAGYTIIIGYGYRSYSTQDAVYNSFKNNRGQDYAEKYAAHAGYSEHQTGLSIDVSDYNNKGVAFEETDSYKWLIDNAYKYGFILRYPEGKENITGCNFESWHFRYVGVDAAKRIHSLGITYDEYYAYYVENK